MARKKAVKQASEKITLEVPVGSDLPSRLGKISKQSGLSHTDLIQKWILQEEFLIGLAKYGKEYVAAKAKKSRRAARRQIPDFEEQEETVTVEHGSPNYRKMLAQRAKKLKKEGMTLKKIAETFNEGKVATVSGTGKWYTSSVSWLLNSAKTN